MLFFSVHTLSLMNILPAVITANFYGAMGSTFSLRQGKMCAFIYLNTLFPQSVQFTEFRVYMFKLNPRKSLAPCCQEASDMIGRVLGREIPSKLVKKHGNIFYLKMYKKPHTLKVCGFLCKILWGWAQKPPDYSKIHKLNILE